MLSFSASNQIEFDVEDAIVEFPLNYLSSSLWQYEALEGAQLGLSHQLEDLAAAAKDEFHVLWPDVEKS